MDAKKNINHNSNIYVQKDYTQIPSRQMIRFSIFFLVKVHSFPVFAIHPIIFLKLLS